VSARESRLPGRVWFAIAALDVAVLVLQFALTKPVLYVATSGADTLEVRSGSDRVAMRSANTPGPLRLRISNRGPERRRVTLTLPTAAHGNQLSPGDLYRVESGDWRIEGDRWVSWEPGSTLVFAADVAEANVAFACGGDEGTVCASAADGRGERCFDLADCSPPDGWETYSLESGNRHWFAGVSLWDGDVRANTREGGITAAWIGLGGRIIERLPVTRGTNAVELDLSFVRLRAMGQLFLDLLFFLLQVAILLVIYSLVGLAFFAPAARGLPFVEALALGAAGGFGIALSVTAGINYLTPLWWGLGAVLALAAVSAVFHRKALLDIVKSAAQVRRDPDARRLLLTILLSTAVFFFPAAIENGWYAGHSYTDSLDYSAWANLSLQAPINQSLGQIRYADFVSLGISSALLGLDPRAAYAAHCAFFWALVPLSTFGFFYRTRGTALALVAAAIAANFAALFAVASQCYMPHFVVLVLDLAGVYAVAWFFEREGPAVHKSWRVFAMAAVFAGAVCIYPYQAFAPLGFAIASVWAAIEKRSWRPLLDVGLIALATVALCQINLEFAVRTGEHTAMHTVGLNNIGRSFVFPFYRNERVFPPMVFGMRDFVNNSRVIDQLCSGIVDRAQCGPVVETTRWINRIALFLTIAYALFFVYGTWSLRRSKAGIAASVMVAILLVLAIIFFRDDQPYFFGKMAMSLAGVAILALAIGLVAGLAHRNRAWRATVAFACVLFVAFNLHSLLFDHIVFFMPRSAPEIYASRTHVMMQRPEMHTLKRFTREILASDCELVIVGELVEQRNSDRDRVAYNTSLPLLSRARLHYATDASVAYFPFSDIGIRDPEVIERGDYLLVWRGRLGFRPPPGFQRIERNDLFSIYARRACAPEDAPCSCRAGHAAR
jgi:hypothetical protein